MFRFSWAVLPLTLAVCLLPAGCRGVRDPWANRPGPKVLAYFPPLYSLAATVAGDDAQVLSLLTFTGPHEFEPNKRDALKLERADLFLTIGLGLDDPIAAKLQKTCGNAKLRLVALGERLPKEMLREGTCKCGHVQHDHSHSHGYDPHVWLGIPEAIVMTEAIRDELCAIDPPKADGYKSRAAAAIDRLKKLQTDGQAMLGGKKDRLKMLTQHDALHYFARTFGAEVVDSIALPGQEPSGKELAKLVQTCQDHGVRLIAVEPQYSAKTAAAAVLSELNRKGIEARFVEIDPLETADPADLTADFYERKMRSNLDNLAGAVK